MTYQELVRKFDENNYGIRPITYVVDAETYGNVCDYIIRKKDDDILGKGFIALEVGPRGGIMVKNVEILLRKTEPLKVEEKPVFPNKFIVLWDGKPVGLGKDSGGYPYKTNLPSLVYYFESQEGAESYIKTMQRMPSYNFTNVEVREIQFRLIDKKLEEKQIT